MVMKASKLSFYRLLRLLSLLFLFILLITTTGSLGGRTLLEKTGHSEEDPLDIVRGGGLENANDLVTMDYTPATKNRPIHN
ncbi:hypothetical protein SDJN03_02602, partial [Cucurbita argyrosperma subsp. sororia]